MMTYEIIPILVASFGGMVLGALFFLGLWLTVKKGTVSKNPALWFLGSLIFRISIVLIGFNWFSNGQWQLFGLCLLGFIFARHMVNHFIERFEHSNSKIILEDKYASQQR